MSRYVSTTRLAVGGVACIFIAVTPASHVTAQNAAAPPDFFSGQAAWQTPNAGPVCVASQRCGEFGAVPGSPRPLRQDPAHPFVPNLTGKQPTYRIGDLSDTNLKEWAKALMKKDNDEVLAGKIAYTPSSSCKPAGVPALMLSGGPFYFLQMPKEVVIIMEDDHEVRHVYLDVPHSANPKPSWYGESVGHYEGNALVIDTIGLNTKTFVDNYRTPHTEKLHVVERWRLIDEGKQVEVRLTIDDPDTYNQPWQGLRTYRRVQGTLQEIACAENNQHLFDYRIPVADKPDF